jgi:4-aminobutyrate aminotransferase
VLGSVFVTPFPHPYRWGMSEDDAVDLSLQELKLKFKHEVAPHNIAAFLIEPVQGEGGYYPAPARFLDELRSIANEHGIKLIYDEVQTGFGRTAEWMASDHYAAKPDIIALGKGIANGLPLSAYGAPPELIDAWPVGSHGTTFGGNPVACGAAVAVLGVMGDLLPHARELSTHAFERLAKLQADHPTIGDVRGIGLMIGIELVEDQESRRQDPAAFDHIKRYCSERELIVVDCGPDGNVIRFIPSLITTMDQLDWALDLLDAALDDYEK